MLCLQSHVLCARFNTRWQKLRNDGAYVLEWLHERTRKLSGGGGAAYVAEQHRAQPPLVPVSNVHPGPSRELFPPVGCAQIGT